MEQLKSWEDMTDLEQAQCTYWDMYKDAYGHRPRGVDTSTWTLADFEQEFAGLGTVIQREEADRKTAEADAIARRLSSTRVDKDARFAVAVAPERNF